MKSRRPFPRAGLTVVLMLCAGTGWVRAAGPGTSSGLFLRLSPGARAAALGEAYTALADDASALYWNPAALTRIQKRSVSLMHSPYLGSSSFDYAAYGQSLGRRGAFGAGVQYYSAGGMAAIDDTGTETGRFTPHGLALSAGYAYEVPRLASVGLAAKFIRSRIATSAETGAVDVGVLSPALAGGRLRLGFAAANLGGRLKYDQESEPLATVLRWGASCGFAGGWTAALDVVLPRDNGPSAGLGVERSWRATEAALVSARAGMNSRTIGEAGGLSGASFGLGLGSRSATFDYAVVPFGALGPAHRVSLTLGR